MGIDRFKQSIIYQCECGKGCGEVISEKVTVHLMKEDGGIG